jgi:hypothetical protein
MKIAQENLTRFLPFHVTIADTLRRGCGPIATVLPQDRCHSEDSTRPAKKSGM